MLQSENKPANHLHPPQTSAACQATKMEKVVVTTKTGSSLIFRTWRSAKVSGNVGITIISHQLGTNYTNYLWWFGGWFIIVIRTLLRNQSANWNGLLSPWAIDNHNPYDTNDAYTHIIYSILFYCSKSRQISANHLGTPSHHQSHRRSPPASPGGIAEMHTAMMQSKLKAAEPRWAYCLLYAVCKYI